MQKITTIVACLVLVLSLCPAALGTNGTNLIAVGPVSRAMGGTGIAAPQDAISAVFSNPAGMCFGPYCPGSEVNFASTFFMPDVKAEVQGAASIPTAFGGQPVNINQNSDDDINAIPAFGLSLPIKSTFPYIRFGLSAFGVSGLGVDFRDSQLDQPDFYGPSAPLVAGEFSQFQLMRFAPSVAVQPTAKWSFGASLALDYSSLDLRRGSKFSYGIGGQIGMIYHPIDILSLGAVYRSPIPVTHNNVFDFDGDGSLDSLDLDAPQEVGLGVALTILENRLLLELDGKWVNWSGADGYEDFDWDDQWVVGLGAQFEIIPHLYARVGYNYAKHPLDDNSGFDGSINPSTGRPNSTTNLQGKTLPTYYFETFRVLGLPAIVEHHLTAGFSYELSNAFSASAGFVHAFENSFDETGTDLAGNDVKIKSELKEWSIDLGFTWRF